MNISWLEVYPWVLYHLACKLILNGANRRRAKKNCNTCKKCEHAQKPSLEIMFYTDIFLPAKMKNEDSKAGNDFQGIYICFVYLQKIH